MLLPHNRQTRELRFWSKRKLFNTIWRLSTVGCDWSISSSFSASYIYSRDRKMMILTWNWIKICIFGFMLYASNNGTIGWCFATVLNLNSVTHWMFGRDVFIRSNWLHCSWALIFSSTTYTSINHTKSFLWQSMRVNLTPMKTRWKSLDRGRIALWTVIRGIVCSTINSLPSSIEKDVDFGGLIFTHMKWTCSFFSYLSCCIFASIELLCTFCFSAFSSSFGWLVGRRIQGYNALASVVSSFWPNAIIHHYVIYPLICSVGCCL